MHERVARGTGVRIPLVLTFLLKIDGLLRGMLGWANIVDLEKPKKKVNHP